jgi:prepilin-type N-terminal cleavage/methylation domain-containing protein
MATSVSKRSRISRTPNTSESGFSLLEVVISMAVLTVGLVSLLGVFGLAMAATQTSQQDMIAKQLANEALESIITARNTSQMNWDDVQNTGATNCPNLGTTTCGIFLPNAQPMYNAGADGIYGTSDDAAAGTEVLREPGPDGIYGNSNDVLIPLTAFQRTIAFTPLTDTQGNTIASLRAVTVTIQYATPQTKLPKSYVLNSYISQYQ